METQQGRYNVTNNENKNKTIKSTIPVAQSTVYTLPNISLDIMGSYTVKVSIHGKTASLPLIVVKEEGMSLLDRNWLEKIKLDWSKVTKINGIIKAPY